MLEIKCWMVNHFKRIQHVFLVLDARKCWMEKFVPEQISSNTFQRDYFIYETLNEIGAFKQTQHFVQYCKFCMVDEMLGPLNPASINEPHFELSKNLGRSYTCIAVIFVYYLVLKTCNKNRKTDFLKEKSKRH